MDLYKVGYLRKTPYDTGWFYEIDIADQLLNRVTELLQDEYVKKISIAKKEN